MLPDLDQLSKYRSVSSWLMSAIGTKQTWQRRRSMSAFGGKADISRTLNELFPSYIGPFPSAGLSRYDALS
jgi:hypothetical protein